MQKIIWQKPSENEPPNRWVGHQSIKTLPLSAFMACLLKQNYSTLTIKNTPIKAELISSWTNIYTQYCLATSAEVTEKTISLMGEICALCAKLIICVPIMEGLFVAPYELHIALLRDWGYTLTYSTNIGYRFELTRVTNELRREETDLIELCRQLEATYKDKFTLQAFDQELQKISEIMMNEIKPENITVEHYLNFVHPKTA